MIPQLQTYRVRDWFALQGDLSLRLDYPLTRDSVVIDAGGYEGKFAALIRERYDCKVHVFEPVPAYVERLRRRFQDDPEVSIHPYGIGGRGSSAIIAVAGDASSAHRPNLSTECIEAPIRSIGEVVELLNIQDIALFKINIEGAEFDLLDTLIQSGLVEQVADIQVQFHDFIPLAHERMLDVRRRLSETHYPTYMFSFVWENWRRRDRSAATASQEAVERLSTHLLMTVDRLREALHVREQQLDLLIAKFAAMRGTDERFLEGTGD